MCVVLDFLTQPYHLTGRVRIYTHALTHTVVVVVVVYAYASTLGRLLPDTKFVPTAHERLSACPGPETILQLSS